MPRPGTVLSLLIFAGVCATACAQTAHVQSGPDVYEDEYVRVPIPPSWSRAKQYSPAADQALEYGKLEAGASFSSLMRALILEKNGFTLTLAYVADRASGIIGGRPIEEFAVPWPAAGQKSDPSECIYTLDEVAGPSSRTLDFESLILDPDRPLTLETCGLTKETSIPQSSELFHVSGRRWFGGYFSTGGYFFGYTPDRNCKEKSYSLTTSAHTPDKLPMPDDRRLQATIQEAGKIVDSIQYKRCPSIAPELPNPR